MNRAPATAAASPLHLIKLEDFTEKSLSSLNALPSRLGRDEAQGLLNVTRLLPEPPLYYLC